MCKLISIEKSGVYQFTLSGYVSNPAEVCLLINGKRLCESEHRISGKFSYSIVCSCFQNEIIEYKITGGELINRWFCRPKFSYKYITKFVCREKFVCMRDVDTRLSLFQKDLNKYSEIREQLLEEVLNKISSVEEKITREVRCRVEDYDMFQKLLRNKMNEIVEYIEDKLKIADFEELKKLVTLRENITTDLENKVNKLIEEFEEFKKC